MLRSSAAIASRMVRLVVASSRQSVLCHRAIVASPDSLKHYLVYSFFNPSVPRFQSPADQSRGYARGKPVIDDDNEDEDEDDDDEEFDHEFEDDEDCMDSDFDEFKDEDDDDDETHRKRK